jgi:lipopolysaccharide transport protein LptA
MNKKISSLFLIIFSLMITNVSSKEDGISIVSNELNVDMDQRTSTFTGDVYANDENLKIWSEKMIIIFKTDKDEIKEILASGNVKIIRLSKGSEIYGDIANYFLEDEIIIVTGNVLVKENNNQVSGSKLTVDLKSSSSIMVGSDLDRVEAVIINN